MKNLLLIGIALFSFYTIKAQEFTSNGIKYKISSSLNSSNPTAFVIAKTQKYTGDIVIPSMVEYNSKGYKVTYIGNDAFYGCTSLTSITIPNFVTNIGDGAFYGCTSLTSITIPNSVTNIGSYAFYGCTSLTSITLSNSLKQINESAFALCTSLTSITLPNTLVSLMNNVFNNCSSLTSITLPNTLTQIYRSTFFRCTGLTSITLPNSLTSIHEQAFYECSKLTSITLPNTLRRIYEDAFSGCSALTFIICEATTPPTLGTNVFKNVIKTIPLHVPESSVDLYKAALQWKDFNVQTLSTVNTNNLTIQPKLKLYPNPATSVITIEIPNNNSLSNLQMFDNTGSLVLNKQLFGTTQISIDELKSGMYLYQHTQDGIVTNGKLIVK